MTQVSIRQCIGTSDSIWRECGTDYEYFDHGSKRAISEIGVEFYGTHEISDDLAYCIFDGDSR